MKTLTRWIPAGMFFIFIVWIIKLANENSSPQLAEIVDWVPYGDKLGHLVLYGILTLLLSYAIKWQRASVVVLCFAIVEEFSQLFISSRSFDLVDILFDIVGIGCFAWLSVYLSSRDSSHEDAENA